jgi:tRNA pseudouridine55 synthase
MQGIILVDKPAAWTSFDVVNYIRKMVAEREGKRPKQIKVGHAGTLDPFATGLLIILVGKDYTRRAAEFSKLDKTYEVTMKLGFTSSTGDPEGEIVRHSEQREESSCGRGFFAGAQDDKPSKEDIQEAFKKFQGEISQTPPAFSAIKVNGQRAYKLARAGEEVKLEARRVTINRLELVKYEFPLVQFTADVSSGTYIRSLVEDVGEILKTGAYTTQLRRTKIGTFTIVRAMDIKDDQVVDTILAIKLL